MSNARDKANIPALNFSSTGIDDNATSTAITIDSNETSTLQCSAGDSNFALLAYHPTSTATRTIAKFQSNVGGTQEDKVVIQTSGNIGIGTSSPSVTLDVNGGTANTVAKFTSTDSNSNIGIFDNSTTGIYLSAIGDDFTIKTASSERMRIDSSGKVGIGNSSMSSFDSEANNLVVGSGSGDQGITIYTGSSAGHHGSIFFADGTSGDALRRGQIRYEHNNEVMSFSTNTSERMRIDSSGNVGIGVSSPVNVGSRAGLQVSGGTNGGVLSLNNLGNEADNPRIVGKVSGTTDMGFYAGGSSGELMFFTNNATERMRITSDGNVNIPSNGSSTYELSIGTSPSVNGGLDLSENNGLAQLRMYKTYDGTTSGVIFRTRHTGTLATVGTIQYGNSSVAYNTTSDYRLKENVSYDFDATTRLKQLKPARFNFISDADTTVDGFLAHEVSSVVPEAISGEKDAVKEDGTPDYQGIDQSKLVPLLVKTIQELEARITTLEANNP